MVLAFVRCAHADFRLTLSREHSALFDLIGSRAKNNDIGGPVQRYETHDIIFDLIHTIRLPVAVFGIQTLVYFNKQGSSPSLPPTSNRYLYMARGGEVFCYTPSIFACIHLAVELMLRA